MFVSRSRKRDDAANHLFYATYGVSYSPASTSFDRIFNHSHFNPANNQKERDDENQNKKRNQIQYELESKREQEKANTTVFKHNTHSKETSKLSSSSSSSSCPLSSSTTTTTTTFTVSQKVTFEDRIRALEHFILYSTQRLKEQVKMSFSIWDSFCNESHQCKSSTCTFVQYKRIVTCVESGHFHVCDNCCPFIVHENDVDVCELTGNVYDRNFASESFNDSHNPNKGDGAEHIDIEDDSNAQVDFSGIQETIAIEDDLSADVHALDESYWEEQKNLIQKMVEYKQTEKKKVKKEETQEKEIELDDPDKPAFMKAPQTICTLRTKRQIKKLELSELTYSQKHNLPSVKKEEGEEQVTATVDVKIEEHSDTSLKRKHSEEPEQKPKTKKPRKAKHVEIVSNYELINKITNVIYLLFKPNKAKTSQYELNELAQNKDEGYLRVSTYPTAGQFKKMALVCADLWQKIIRVPLFENRKGTYTLDNHIFVTVSLMSSGFNVGDKCYIQKYNVVHQLFHHRAVVINHNTTKWKSKTITKCENFIRELVKQIEAT